MCKYEALFPTMEDKARAFDKMAREFYFCNFGTMSKADFETLMFSLYIDQILDRSEADFQTYSDYILSKQLGISQSRVSSLKEKKELKYPYPNFDWKKSFLRLVSNARYEDEKIKVFIPDRNLYLEIKNAIETNGGYVDKQLNSKLLQIRPEYFVDLLMLVSDETDRSVIQKKIKETLKSKDLDSDFLNQMSFGEYIKSNAPQFGLELVTEILSECIPVVGKGLSNVIKMVYDRMKINTGVKK